ncbi:MAG: ribosome small subunit-dependent GTPase A [Clostridia bacterium]|nr:ribosome small subunit-dependent GTPase A [Clostridia bacterium]
MKILSCSCGVYTVMDGEKRITCRARGVFRHVGTTPLPGDEVTLRETPDGVFIDGVKERKNSLIRPALANISRLIICVAVKDPAPSQLFTDRMTAAAEAKGIEPVIVVTKADLDPEGAERLAAVYESAGYETAVTGTGGVPPFEAIAGRGGETPVIVFAGASGAGKSTLINRLFPELTLKTGEISGRIGRGKNTTRDTTVFPFSSDGGIIREGDGRKPIGFVADTPGFTSLDFVKFDFLKLSELEPAFREFRPYLGKCLYSDCRHLGDEGCAVQKAAEEGSVYGGRLESYRTIYKELREKERNYQK